MPKSFRRIALYAVSASALLAGATCADSSLTGPGGSGLRTILGFAPAFTKAALDIYRGLVAFQLEVDNVHVVLKRQNGAVAKDTVVLRQAGQDEISIELSVELEAPEELLDARIELRDGGQVLFAGTQRIVARRAGLPGSAPPAVALEYTGPGAAATALDVTPTDTTILATDSVVLAVAASDSEGQPVADLNIQWTVKDADLGTVTAAGVFKPTAVRGNTYVIARLPTNVRDSAHITFTPIPARVVLVSGGGQTGTVGRLLSQPLVVEVQANDDLPVAGAVVSFAVLSGGGLVTPASAVTDANGRASATLTLGNVPGTNSVQVSVGERPPIQVSATSNPTGPGLLDVTTAPSAVAVAGVSLAQQPVVQLRDSLGNLLTTAGLSIHASLAGDGMTLGGTASATTDLTGKATFANLRIDGPVGTAQLRFTLGETDIQVLSDPVTVVAGHARALGITQQPSELAAAGVALLQQPRVQLRDQFGNTVPAAGVPVIAALLVAGEGRTLGGTATVNTDATGLAAFSDLSLSGLPGISRIVFAVADSVTTAVSNAITLDGPSELVTIVSGDAQGALRNEFLAQPLVVRVTDPLGTPLSGVTVTFAVDSGGGQFGDQSTMSSVVTGTGGVASIDWFVGTGQQRVSATVGESTALFRAYVATQYVMLTQPTLNPRSGVMLATQPRIRLADAAGNVVRRAGVATWAELVRVNLVDAIIQLTGNQGATTDADGIATFSDLTIEGEIIQQSRLEFYHVLNDESADPNIARAATGTIVLQAGVPLDIVADAGFDYHVLDAGGTRTLGVLITDGFNPVPNAAVTFQLFLGGQTACTLSNAQPATNTSGIATVDVTIAGSMVSCVVHGASTDIGGEGAQVLHRLYVAPTGVAVWSGDADGSWSASQNWIPGTGLPSPTASVFIPAAAAFTHFPTINAVEQVSSLAIEPGALLNVDRATLGITNSLAADGLINGVAARVSMNGASGTVRGNVFQAELIIALEQSGACNRQTPYIVSGPLVADSLTVDCALLLDRAFPIAVNNRMFVAQTGSFRQTDGSVGVGTWATTAGLVEVVGTGAAFSVIGDLTVQPTGRLSQSAGTIFVQGDAAFNGFESLTGGQLVLNRHFSLTANGDNQRMAGALPHLTQFVGDATAVREIRWNSVPSGSTFGQVHFSALGESGTIFATDSASADIRAVHAVVTREALLTIPGGQGPRFTLHLGGVPDNGLTIEPNGRINNQGSILIPNAPTLCLSGLIIGIITGGFDCRSLQ